MVQSFQAWISNLDTFPTHIRQKVFFETINEIRHDIVCKLVVQPCCNACMKILGLTCCWNERGPYAQIIKEFPSMLHCEVIETVLNRIEFVFMKTKLDHQKVWDSNMAASTHDCPQSKDVQTKSIHRVPGSMLERPLSWIIESVYSSYRDSSRKSSNFIAGQRSSCCKSTCWILLCNARIYKALDRNGQPKPSSTCTYLSYSGSHWMYWFLPHCYSYVYRSNRSFSSLYGIKLVYLGPNVLSQNKLPIRVL